MCGITGLWSADGRERRSLAETVQAMTGTLVHRGPDDSGIFVDEEAGLALGFRRLAIIDLSEHGAQPMRSKSGRFTMIFNGEVYNHTELRSLLQRYGAAFRGHSDTEVMLEAMERWGVEGALSRFNGMFALAVWDSHDRALTLARDRMGKKPLFISRSGGLLLFGSELKSLAAHPRFDRELSRTAVLEYLRYLYVPAPRSIFQRVEKLPPGHFVTFKGGDFSTARPEAYWRLSDHYSNQRTGIGLESAADSDLVDTLHELLRDAVKLRMIADVPLGALLSGGIDSSTIVAIMQEQSSEPVRTFTIGFDDREHDEARHARRVAAHLGTRHTELHLDGAAALDVVPRLPAMFDEPLADPSQIPTYLICGLARQHVTVALTGDGGDELFAGYHRYIEGERLIRRASAFPYRVRTAAAALLDLVPRRAWSALEHSLANRMPRLLASKARKAANLLRERDPDAMYRSLLSMWQRPELLVPGALSPAGSALPSGNGDGRGLLRSMMFIDQMTYLPDDLLAKVDRASMAVSLEARVPLLDRRIVELSWQLPHRLLIRDGVGKWILRQVLNRYVPLELVDRPKMGFSVPIADWLSGPLRELASDLLAPSEVRAAGVLDDSRVSYEWSRFLRGDRSEALGIWSVLLLQAWCREWRPSGVAEPSRSA